MADNYTIIGQKPSMALNPNGTGFTNVWEVTYRVTDGPSKGTMASVEVPDDEHDAAHVKEAIEAKIANLDDIASL